MTSSETLGTFRLAVGLVLLATALALSLAGVQRGFAWWRAGHAGAPAGSAASGQR